MRILVVPAALALFACAPRYSVYETKGAALRGEKAAREDSLFVRGEGEKHGSRAQASLHHSDLGWRFLQSTSVGWSIPFYQALNNPGKIDRALGHFNKARLLDSLNAQAYWGIALIASRREKDLGHAADLMERAAGLDTSSTSLWFDFGVASYEALQSPSASDTGRAGRGDLYRGNAIRAFEKVLEARDRPDLKGPAQVYLLELRKS
jgi:hypothetical protein